MSKALLDLQAEIKAELEAASKTVDPPSNFKISTKGKQFTLPDGTSSRGPMAAVILDYRTVHNYYKGSYDPSKPEAPSCFAISKVVEGMKPSDNAADPQSEQCHDCAFNQWKSAPTGNGKACKNIRRLALVPPNADKDTRPMIIDVSPTALKHFDGFINKLTKMGMIPAQVIANIDFADSDFPQLTFAVGEAHGNEKLMWKLREDAQELLNKEPSSG